MAWNDMVGDDRVRFCNQCSLNVYNISAMTKLEAESFIANAEGRICAKFYRRADGAILTRDCPVGLRAVRKKVSRAAATAFSALISLFGGSALFAQQQPKNETNVDVRKTFRRYGQAAVEGKVTDMLNAAIAGAEISLINEQTKREISTRANESGRFRFMDVEPGLYTIRVDSPGFSRLEFSRLNFEEETTLNLAVTLKVGSTEMLGLIVTPSTIPTNDTIPQGELKRKDRPRE
jgi:hypothetical protein